MSDTTISDDTSRTPDVPDAEDDLDRRYAERMAEAVERDRAVRRRRNRLVRVSQVAIVAVLLGTWEWLPSLGIVSADDADLYYGRPSGVAEFMTENWGLLWENTAATVQAAVLGFTIGAAFGVLAGLALGRWRLLDRAFDPVLTILAGLPRIALAPLFLLWFGITMQAKVAVSVSAVFFVVLFNTRAGVRSVDDDLQTVAKLLGANERQRFTKIILPGSVPVLFAGLRLAMIFAILGVIASEMVSSRDGLGLYVVQFGQLLQPNGVFAVLAMLAAMMAVFNGVLKLAERRLLRWMPDR